MEGLKVLVRADPKLTRVGNCPTAVVNTVRREATTWPLEMYDAAGGVVIADGSVMLLRRDNGAVRLPKGHREAGESPEACALREVGEETGLHGVRIVCRLGTVENHFASAGTRFRRLETWFLMTTDDPAVYQYVCDDRGSHRPWVPTWFPLDQACTTLSFQSERLVARWAMHAAGKLGEQSDNSDPKMRAIRD